jgi:hypothetical protein
MARGRPIKLTPDVQQRLVAAIKAGNYHHAACRYAGVGYRTFTRWMAKGKKARRGPFRDFRDAVLRAEAEAEMTAVAAWKASMPTHPAEYRHFLAKRWPQRWSEKRRLELIGRRGRLPRLDLDISRAEDMTLEQVDARLDEIQGRGGRKGGPVRPPRPVEEMTDRELHALIDRALGARPGFTAARLAERVPAAPGAPGGNGRPDGNGSSAGPGPAAAANVYDDLLVEGDAPPLFGGDEG